MSSVYHSIKSNQTKSLTTEIKNYSKFKKIESNEIRTKIPFKLSDNSIFIEKNKHDLDVYIIPKGKSLWHGTTANTSEDKTTLEWLNNIEKNNIEQTLNRPLYLADKQTCSKYGSQKDNAKIVSIVNHNITPGSTCDPSMVIPLYCVNGSHGIDIEFRVKEDIKLLDIGYSNNMKKVIKIIKTTIKDKTQQNEYISVLRNTCITHNDDTYTSDSNSEKLLNSLVCKRISTEWFDPDLVKLLCSDIDLDIDGWIYFAESTSSSFHSEILLCKPNDKLKYRSTHTVPDTVFPDNIPTFEELQASRPKFTQKYNDNGFKLSLSYNITVKF